MGTSSASSAPASSQAAGTAWAHLRSVFGDIEKDHYRSPEQLGGSDSAPVRRSVVGWQ